METNKLKKTINDFLPLNDKQSFLGDNTEVWDNQTGECQLLNCKDGIVERINKKFIIEDGRQLLQD